MFSTQKISAFLGVLLISISLAWYLVGYRGTRVWITIEHVGVSFHKHGYEAWSIQWCAGNTVDCGSKLIRHNWIAPTYRHIGKNEDGYLGPIELWYTK